MKKETVLSYVQQVIRSWPEPPRDSSLYKLIILGYKSYSGRCMAAAGIFILLATVLIFVVTTIKTTTDIIIGLVLGIIFVLMGLFGLTFPFFSAWRIHHALKYGVVAKANIEAVWEKETRNRAEQAPPGSAFVAKTTVEHPRGNFQQNIELLDMGEGPPKMGGKVFVLVHPRKRKVLVDYQLLWELS